MFLKFEGDKKMEVILSKEFLIEEDKKIKDEKILRKIGNGVG